MTSSVFSSIPEITPDSPVENTPHEEVEPNNVGAEVSGDLIDSEKATEVLLTSIGIDDIGNLPEEYQNNVRDVSSYVYKLIESRGLMPNENSFNRVLSDLKFEMGLDSDAVPEIILDRIGGVIDAWRNLSFIGDPKEKRSIFMKLARLPDSKAMNKLVFEMMSKKEVWQ